MFKEIQYYVTGEGFIGVSFFFILSGFILSLNYDERLLSRQVSIREFWVARIARVYPLHLVTLLLALGFTAYTTQQWGDFFVDPANSIVAFLSNATLIHAFIPVPAYFFSYNVPSWSISDEMFFYFAFPFIIMLCVPNKALLRYGWLLLLVVPVVMYFSLTESHHPFLYINPFFRIIDFILGIMLHQVYKRGYFDGWFRTRGGATLLELLALVVFGVLFYYHNDVPMGYRFSCYYWLAMALIIFCFAYQRGYLSVLLSGRVMVLLGEISFSFYLLHQLLMRILLDQNGRYHFTDNTYVLAAIMFVLTLVLSYVLHRFVELPSNRYIKARFRRSRFAAPSVSPAAVAPVVIAESAPADYLT